MIGLEHRRQPTRRWLLFSVVVSLGINPGSAMAQDPATPNITSTRRVLPAWMEGSLTFHFLPEIRFRAGRLAGDASALMGGGGQEPRRAEVQVASAFGIPTMSALRFEVEGGLFQTGGGPDVRAHGVEGGFRLMHQDEGGIVWIGGALASSWDDETSRRARVLVGGAWKALGGTGLGVSLRGVAYDEELVLGRDTTYEVLGFPFTSHRTEQIVFDHYYIDAELMASRRVGPVAFHLEGGGRLTRRSVHEPRSWVRGGVDIPILSDLALQIAAGQRPNLPESRVEAGSFVSVGLAIELGRRDGTSGPVAMPDAPSPDAPRAELHALSGGNDWELLVRNVQGARVEVMGDPTNWQPLDMESMSLGSWRVVLRMVPGTYRVNMRVDGGVWGELPGYPTAKDEFGGVVGVIVIESSATR